MTTIDLVSGFLGAGKTTFIRLYAAWLKSRGERPFIVENEFGFLNIDSALLRQDGIDVAELSGGCICCGLKRDFRELLIALAEPGRRVVVEPSGIFDPRDFFEVMADPHVQERCRVGAAITVVDPHAYPEITGESLELFRRQLAWSGAVILSKTGGMDAAARREAEEGIRAFPDSPPAATIESRPWEEYGPDDFAALSRAAPPDRIRNGGFIDHAALYESLIIRSNRVFSPGDLRKAVDKAFRTGGLVRIKGYVPRPDGGHWEVNCTARDRLIREAPGKARSFLVLVGRKLNREIFENLFGRA